MAAGSLSRSPPGSSSAASRTSRSSQVHIHGVRAHLPDLAIHVLTLVGEVLDIHPEASEPLVREFLGLSLKCLSDAGNQSQSANRDVRIDESGFHVVRIAFVPRQVVAVQRQDPGLIARPALRYASSITA